MSIKTRMKSKPKHKSDATIPNRITVKALKKSDEDKDLIRCKDKDDLFDKLEI